MVEGADGTKQFGIGLQRFEGINLVIDLLQFGSIAMGFTLLFLVGGRLLLLGPAVVGRTRAPADAGEAR